MVCVGGRQKATTLFTRIGDLQYGRNKSWKFIEKESAYLSEYNGPNRLTIAIDHVDFQDEGYYKCKDGWKNITAEFKVEIVSLPKLEFAEQMGHSQMENIQLEVGTCTTTQSRPPSTIKWIDQNNKTYSGTNHPVQRNGYVSSSTNTLVIPKLSIQDHHKVSLYLFSLLFVLLAHFLGAKLGKIYNFVIKCQIGY